MPGAQFSRESLGIFLQQPLPTRVVNRAGDQLTSLSSDQGVGETGFDLLVDAFNPRWVGVGLKLLENIVAIPHPLCSRKKDQTKKRHSAVVRQENSLVERAILTLVDHDQIQTVFKRLQRRSDCGLGVYPCRAAATLRRDPTRDLAAFDLGGRKHPIEAPRLLPLLERSHLELDYVLDELT
jgi:hypothetical protein